MADQSPCFKKWWATTVTLDGQMGKYELTSISIKINKHGQNYVEEEWSQLDEEGAGAKKKPAAKQNKVDGNVGKKPAMANPKAANAKKVQAVKGKVGK